MALTFDDGPGPYTRLVLAKLRKHHVFLFRPPYGAHDRTVDRIGSSATRRA